MPSCEGQSPVSRSVSWATPEWILEHFRPYFDPCPITASDEVLLDGLCRDWDGFTFINPPFGGRNVGPWIGRALDHGDCAVIVPARMDTVWFQSLAGGASMFWFPAGRVKYHNARVKENGGPSFPSVIVAIGRTAEARILSIAKAHRGLLLRR